jgi:phosphatidylglycerol:prolipoprotein diacylglycerol transferase
MKIIAIKLVQIVATVLAADFVGGFIHWLEDAYVREDTPLIGKIVGRPNTVHHHYLGVIVAKRLLGYTAATGDWFAIIVPIGIMLGRIGCFINGCCLGRVCEPSWFTLNDAHGVPRWPAVPVEFLFNAIMLGLFLMLRWGRIARGQLFHIYLIAYGIFRFFHEFLRDTPQIIGPFSGYQFAALGVTALGAIGFVLRRNAHDLPNSKSDTAI